MHRIPSTHFMHASLSHCRIYKLSQRLLFASASYFLANKSLKNEPAPPSPHSRHAAKKERKNIFIFISCAALIVKSKADAADAAAAG